MGHVSPSPGTQGPACGVSGCCRAVGAPNICLATRTLRGLTQGGQARGEGRSGARDPPQSGTPALTFTQSHERAAEAPSPRLEEQPGSCSPGFALQQWKIFLTGLGGETCHSAQLVQASPGERSCVETLQPSAIRLHLQPQFPGDKTRPVLLIF